MKTQLLSLSAAPLIGLMLGATPARAQEYPWCTITSLSGGSPRCSYVTFEQCQASILGAGGFCQPNPRAPAPTPTRPTRRGKR
jgi:hypothetical protein